MRARIAICLVNLCLFLVLKKEKEDQDRRYFFQTLSVLFFTFYFLYYFILFLIYSYCS